MPTAEFFEQFGLYAVKNFLDRDFCVELCEELETAPSRKGTFVKPHTKDEVIDEEIKRRREVTKIPDKLKNEVNRKLLDLKPEIEKHFKLALQNIQLPKYSIYQTGDFYRVHMDANMHEDTLDFLKERKVSAIIFLNEESTFETEGKYCGGNLTFHGLMENDVFGKFGFPLVGEPGMLITFLPNIVHEVTPVTAGTRFAITTWYI